MISREDQIARIIESRAEITVEIGCDQYVINSQELARAIAALDATPSGNTSYAAALEAAARMAEALRWEPSPNANPRNTDLILRITKDWSAKIAAAIRALPVPQEVEARHSFTGNGPGIVGADNCQICGRWWGEPETYNCKNNASPPHQEPATVRLGDYVRMDESSPYFADWQDATMKVVGLHLAPDGTLWADVIEGDLRHRGCGQYDGETTGINADYLCRVTPLYAHPPAPAVRVKALEWEAAHPSSVGLWRACTMIGTYDIADIGGTTWQYQKHNYVLFAERVDSLETAKAAAQADYERRIMSAIEVTHDPVADRLRASGANSKKPVD